MAPTASSRPPSRTRAQVGIDILKAGGNAVDAAVAVGFAQGVLEPNANGLGGGGFMTIKLASMKEAIVIDFREIAPAASKVDMYKFSEDGKNATRRHRARRQSLPRSGFPGGRPRLGRTRRRRRPPLRPGKTMDPKKLTRAQIMQPAIDWCMKVPVTANLNGMIKDNFDKIRLFPADAKIYLKDGLPYEVGDTIQNPDLQNTLKAIAKGGAKAYYEGDIAKKIAAEVQAQGGHHHRRGSKEL